MSISEQIEVMINNLTDNNHPPQIVTITKAYNNNTCDIQTNTGILQRVECSGQPIKDTKGLLTYQEGKQNNPFVILFEDAETIIHSLGLGKFKIGTDGHLYVELPNNMENIFSINQNGHLTVELDTGIVNNYSINETGHLTYDRWDV